MLKIGQNKNAVRAVSDTSSAHHFPLTPTLLMHSVLVLSLVFGLGAFSNFSVPTVVTVYLLYASPILILYHVANRRVELSRPSRRLGSIVLTFLASCGLLGFQLLGFIRFNSINYAVNMPDALLASGTEVHYDTTFHQSLIYGILQFGYPTTSLHDSPATSYHAVAHYLDAFVLAITDIEPWEGYALIFMAKSASIVLASLYFSSRVSTGLAPWTFWVISGATAVGLNYSWYPVGSHSQWIATILLLVALPEFSRFAQNKKIPIPHIVLMVLAAGALFWMKVMAALGLVITLGLLLLIRNPTNPRTWILLFSWAGSLFVMVTFTGNFLGLDSRHRFDVGIFFGSYEIILASIILATSLFLMGRSSKKKELEQLATVVGGGTGALGIILLVYGGVGWGDVIQFYENLFHVQLLITLCVAVPALARESERRESESGVFPAWNVALVLSLLAALLPVSLSQSSLLWSPDAVRGNLISANSATYNATNSFLPKKDRFSVFRALTGQSDPENLSIVTSSVTELRDQIEELLRAESLEKEDVLLFLAAEDYSYLEDEYAITPWASSLLVRSATGTPMVFGIGDLPPHGPGAYGMGAYQGEGKRISRTAQFELALCQFSVPVLDAKFEGTWRVTLLECEALKR